MPWCPHWREHSEAITYLHAFWLAWQDRTSGDAEITGPAQWHRDYPTPTMDFLRAASGPFAGCKKGVHRATERPSVDDGTEEWNVT
jgi:hypothetical protein